MPNEQSVALRPNPNSLPLVPPLCFCSVGEVGSPVLFGDGEVAFGGLDDQRVIVIGPGLGPPTLKNAHSNATGGHSGVIVKC